MVGIGARTRRRDLPERVVQSATAVGGVPEEPPGPQLRSLCGEQRSRQRQPGPGSCGRVGHACRRSEGSGFAVPRYSRGTVPRAWQRREHGLSATCARTPLDRPNRALSELDLDPWYRTSLEVPARSARRAAEISRRAPQRSRAAGEHLCSRHSDHPRIGWREPPDARVTREAAAVRCRSDHAERCTPSERPVEARRRGLHAPRPPSAGLRMHLDAYDVVFNRHSSITSLVAERNVGDDDAADTTGLAQSR